jgi:putative membrane protein
MEVSSSMEILQNFSFTTLWNPEIIVILFLIGLAYFYINKKGNHNASTKQKSFFITGLVVIYIGFGSPIDVLAHLLFSVHMVQMSLLFMVAPPFILKGLPASMVRPVLEQRFIKKVFPFLSNPLITLIFFNGLFSIYHIPIVFDTVMTNYTLHPIFHGTLLIAAFFMWWPIACPVPEYDKLSELKKLGYIFADGVLLTPACALIIFSKATMYGTYTDPQTFATALGYCLPAGISLADINLPGLVQLMNPLEDQQLGGVLMKVIQEIVYGTAIGFIFISWVRNEKANSKKNDADLAKKYAFATEGNRQ